MSSRQSSSLRVFLAGLVASLLLVPAVPTSQSPAVNSGSDGSDGALSITGQPGTVVVFDPAQFHGTHVAANVFNFTTINIGVGVTVKLTANKLTGPVYWLAQGDVTIAGTLDLNGANGAGPSANSLTRATPTVAGPGGYAGGVGGNPLQLPTAGTGPGGGARALVNSTHGIGGTFTGNSVLLPLIGGSGGGGATRTDNARYEANGGAGGGAILIASSTQITVSGSILANGGSSTIDIPTCCILGQVAGGGSGGAIRLVATLISGSGALRVNGGASHSGGASNGGSGRVRLEAFSNTFSGQIQGTSGLSVPNALLVPTAGSPTARVISIAGVTVSPNPETFPDLTINTSSPVDVVIQTQHVPSAATITLTILGEAGAADTVVTAPPLSNCSGNVCTTTVQVVFRPGASRGLTRVTWTQ